MINVFPLFYVRKTEIGPSSHVNYYMKVRLPIPHGVPTRLYRINTKSNLWGRNTPWRESYFCGKEVSSHALFSIH